MQNHHSLWFTNCSSDLDTPERWDKQTSHWNCTISRLCIPQIITISGHFC